MDCSCLPYLDSEQPTVSVLKPPHLEESFYLLAQHPDGSAAGWPRPGHLAWCSGDRRETNTLELEYLMAPSLPLSLEFFVVFLP